MDHPHIAKVLDAGATDDGRPFFVMELVQGVPITEFCDRHRLGITERLNLLRQVCSAVQHAHQKGIIHRDLKPSNILVESHDGAPVPRVIDFGLAKATSGLPLTDASLHTALGAVAGTPLYMAPEQASFRAIDIDTRADVYALGVILYELLTGSTPIPRERMRQAALDEVFRLVRESEPPTPSSRLSTLDALPTIAASRQTEPARLGRFVKGDLDWITMKALARERQRRYESPSALARDLERFLGHEPVTAGPPTATYRLRKFIRRHRVPVLAASLVLLSLVAGIIGTSLALLEARRQQEIARGEFLAKSRALEEAERQEREARDQRDLAQARLAQAEASNEILSSIFSDLDPRAIETGGDLRSALSRQLDEAARRVSQGTLGDPLAVARMQLQLGVTQLNLGNDERAMSLLDQARAVFLREHGEEHEATLLTMTSLAAAYRSTGRLAEARELLLRTRPIHERLLGRDDPKTLLNLSELAHVELEAGNPTQAINLWEDCLQRSRDGLGPDHPIALTHARNLASAYREAGRLRDAVRLLEDTVPRLREHLPAGNELLVLGIDQLASVYQSEGRVREARALFEEALELSRRHVGEEAAQTAITLNNLALLHKEAGRLPEAISSFERALRIFESRIGPENPRTIGVMGNLGTAYMAAGRLAEAEPLLIRAAAAAERVLGPANPTTLTITRELASHFEESNRLDQAIQLREELLERAEAHLEASNPERFYALGYLALAYEGVERFEEARALNERALQWAERHFGADHLDTLRVMNNLAMSHFKLGEPSRAVPILADLVERFRDKVGPSHPNTVVARTNLAAALLRDGQIERARPLLAELPAAAPPRPDAVRLELASRWVALLPILHERQLWPEAETLGAACLAIRERAIPDDWRTSNTRSLLGEALLRQGRLDESEPLLKAGYDGLKQRADQIPPNDRVVLTEALDRLIAWAEAAGKPDEAERWKTEKASLADPPPPAADAK
jgi:tetratricopeptide (TPR) repeat protein